MIPLVGFGLVLLFKVCRYILMMALVYCIPLETTFRSDVPISDPIKLQKVPLAMEPPPEARDIYYLYRVEGFQIMYFYMRFSVPPDKVDDVVKSMVANYEMQDKDPAQLLYEPITTPSRFTPDAQFLPMPWWDTRSIKSGYYMGVGLRRNTPQIWVDREHGTVFVYMTD